MAIFKRTLLKMHSKTLEKSLQHKKLFNWTEKLLYIHLKYPFSNLKLGCVAVWGCQCLTFIKSGCKKTTRKISVVHPCIYICIYTENKQDNVEKQQRAVYLMWGPPFTLDHYRCLPRVNSCSNRVELPWHWWVIILTIDYISVYTILNSPLVVQQNCFKTILK